MPLCMKQRVKVMAYYVLKFDDVIASGLETLMFIIPTSSSIEVKKIWTFLTAASRPKLSKAKKKP